jgi:hypothetical protein
VNGEHLQMIVVPTKDNSLLISGKIGIFGTFCVILESNTLLPVPVMEDYAWTGKIF